MMPREDFDIELPDPAEQQVRWEISCAVSRCGGFRLFCERLLTDDVRALQVLPAADLAG
jgi:hypothetical protein